MLLTPLQVPLSTSGLLDLIKMARSWKKRAPERPETKPAIVLSHNGHSRVGVYIAANVAIEQMEMDGEVDVFHAVKMIRINRPQLVDTKVPYPPPASSLSLHLTPPDLAGRVQVPLRPHAPLVHDEPRLQRLPRRPPAPRTHTPSPRRLTHSPCHAPTSPRVTLPPLTALFRPPHLASESDLASFTPPFRLCPPFDPYAN